MTTEAADVNEDQVIRETFSCGGKALPVSTKRVASSLIEQARRALRSAPECTAKDIPKGEAIRALIPDIHEMRAKGYDWSAIAELLSEQGITVTAVTLKSHLQQAKAASRRRSRRTGVGGKGSGVKAPRAAREHRGTDTWKAAGGAEHRAEKSAPPLPVAVPKQPAEQAPRAVRAPAEEAASRRSAFVPEEDSDDL